MIASMIFMITGNSLILLALFFSSKWYKRVTNIGFAAFSIGAAISLHEIGIDLHG